MFRLHKASPNYGKRFFLRRFSELLPHKRKISTPVFQVFGANTDVGKSVFSAGICRAAFAESYSVKYIKPVQTGTNQGISDINFIEANCPADVELETYCIVSYGEPVSPHIAARTSKTPTLSDQELVHRMQEEIISSQFQSKPDENHLVLVETAGGPNSPAPSGTLQVDAYRPLRLPVVLIGDYQLGGISTTLSSLDSLQLRGYDVVAVALFDHLLGNHECIQDNLDIPVLEFTSLPRVATKLGAWYSSNGAQFSELFRVMIESHQKNLHKLKHMAEKAEKIFWWPFTQHKLVKKATVIDSAHGDNFTVIDGGDEKHMFDACGSWWTQGVGHGRSEMSKSLSYVLGRYGHVMFPGNVHEPALNLSEILLAGVGKGWAERVFFSDNGATAVEVALKMAFRKFAADNATSVPFERLKVIALQDAYHGDTLAPMDIQEPNILVNGQHPWYESKGLYLNAPSVYLKDGIWRLDIPACFNTSNAAEFDNLDDVFALDRQDSRVTRVYEEFIDSQLGDNSNDERQFGALILEPVIQGAAGMKLNDPLFQRILIQKCRTLGIPVIYDEVFTGLWRLGVQSARDLLQINPDISCFSKLVTGGVLPLGLTLATKDIFQVFYSDQKAQALLHGHSYTAHVSGCAAAIEALQIYTNTEKNPNYDSETNLMREYWDSDVIKSISHLKGIRRVICIGTVFAVEVEDDAKGYASSASDGIVEALRNHNIFARPLGNVLYIMCTPISPPDSCKYVLDTVYDVLQTAL